MYQVGNIIAIKTAGSLGISAFGVVLKSYKDNRCFVRILRNYSINKSLLKSWKNFTGTNDRNYYYVSDKDSTYFVGKADKTRYTVPSVPAYCCKESESKTSGYVKHYSKTISEVYTFENSKLTYIPSFVIFVDVLSGRLAVTVKRGQESFNEMARRCYARIQLRKFEEVAK